MITRQIVADKIAEYLHGKLSQAELVDWAERAVMVAAATLCPACRGHELFRTD